MEREPGWYPHPQYPEDERWWDGSQWGPSRPIGHTTGGPRVDVTERRSLRVVAIVLVLALGLSVGGWWVMAQDARTPPVESAVELRDGYSVMLAESGAPAAFDTCRPWGVRWNLADAADERGRLERALGRLADATGATFRDYGSTTVVPGGSGDGTIDAELPNTLTIAITPSDASQGSAYLDRSPDVVGAGGWLSPGRSIEHGFVVIDGSSLEGLTTDQREALYLHELAHAVGLGHSVDPADVMYPTLVDAPPTHYSAADLQGLRELSDGC